MSSSIPPHQVNDSQYMQRSSFSPLFWWVVLILGVLGVAAIAISVMLNGLDIFLFMAAFLISLGLFIGSLLFIRTQRLDQEEDAIVHHKVTQLSILNRLSRQLALSNDLADSYIATRNEILNLVEQASTLSVYLLTQNQSQLKWAYRYKHGEDLATGEISPVSLKRQDLVQWVAEFGRPLLVQQNTRALLPNEARILADAIDGSWLGLPLTIANTQIGVLTIGNADQVNAFTQNDVDMLATAAATLAITIQNHRLLSHTQVALQKQAQQSVQLRTATEVSSALGDVLNPEQLMQQTIDLILERFDLYYVGFFLIDENDQYAVLQAGTGVAGQEQLANNHKHRVSSRSLIGGATADGRPRVHQDVRYADNWFANPHLPDTRSEIALPLRARGRILGALTAQSVEVNKFVPELVKVLQSMCDQIAVALDNATLFSQLQANVNKIERLYQAERQLVEASSREHIYEAIVHYAAQTDLFDVIRIIAPNEKRTGSYDRNTRHWIRPSLLTSPEEEVDFSSENDVPFYNLPTTEFSRVENISTLELPQDSFLHQYGLNSLILFPINLGQRWFGSLIIACVDKLPPSQQLQSMVTLCDQAAIVLSNQNLLNETSTLYSLSRRLSEALTQGDMAQITAQKLVTYTGAKQVRILFHDRSLNLTKIATSTNNEVEILARDYILDDPVYLRFQESDTEFVVIDRGDEEPSSIVARYLRPYQIQATLFIPAISQRDLIGFIMLDSAEGHWPFTASSMNFSRTAADQFAVTNENFILFNQTLGKAQELVMLNQIGSKIASTLDASRLARIVFDESKRLILSDWFMLAKYDHETRQYQSLLLVHNEEFFSPVSGAVPRLVEGQLKKADTQIFKRGNTILKQIAELFPFTLNQAQETLFTPLYTEQQPIGFMIYLAEQSNRYDENHIQLARAIANQTALGLVNADLLDETQNTVAELRTLFNVTQSLASSVEAKTRLRNTLQTLHYTLRRADIALVLGEADGENPQVMAYYGRHYTLPTTIEWEESPVAQAIRQNTPLLLNTQGEIVSRNQQGGTYREIIVPLSLAKEIVGAIHVKHHSTEVFNERDLRLLQTLSVSLAATVENGRLFQQIQEANERLLELDKMKTQFLANMSHELRTPLNSIIGFSRLILKGIDGPINDVQQEDLTSIYNSGQHLLRLINDILDLAKLDAGKMPLIFANVDVYEMSETLHLIARGLLKEKDHIRLIWDIAPDLPTIEGDEVRLRQVLLNLLSNAVKFTEEGFIHLRIEKAEDDQFIHISVKDTGVGIAEKDFPRLFRKFEQIDNSSTRAVEGTGLGLPIVHELVQLHQGHVWLESKVRHGSTFHILIPVRQTAEGEQVNEPTAIKEMITAESIDPPEIDLPLPVTQIDTQEPPPPQKTNGYPAILLVDDEPGILSLYERYLSSLPNPVLSASDGRAALATLRQNGQIGLVLLDIHMPELNGWQVLEAMRRDQNLLNIPVVICSVDVNIEEAKNKGAQLALPKPIISDDLTRVLELMQPS